MTTIEKLLTETELMLMNILWEIEEGTVRDVMANLSENKKLAYTSVSTILRILEKKDVLRSTKEGKSHIYSPLVLKEDYQKKGLNHLVTNVFSGTPSDLVKTLLETQSLNLDDLEELKKIISKRIDL
jgi:predicted transcriptional regulator